MAKSKCFAFKGKMKCNAKDKMMLIYGLVLITIGVMLLAIYSMWGI